MIDQPLEQRFEDIELGQKKKFTIKITESMINNFAMISGDYNPLHMDENYASTTPFKSRLCHGMLLASLFSRLVGMYLPGKHALLFSQSLNFPNVCFIGDTVTVEGEVLDKSEGTRIITVKTKILNNSGSSLVEGQAKIIVRE